MPVTAICGNHDGSEELAAQIRCGCVPLCPYGSDSASIISVVIASSLADGKVATEREVSCDTSLLVTVINRSCHVAQHRKTFANVIAAPSRT